MNYNTSGDIVFARLKDRSLMQVYGLLRALSARYHTRSAETKPACMRQIAGAVND